MCGVPRASIEGVSRFPGGPPFLRSRRTATSESRSPTMNDEPTTGQPQSGLTRRRLIASSIAGSLAAPLLFGARAGDAAAAFDQLKVAPVYFPRSPFTPDIADLSGKLAVVTGASRGNGRAVGEALANLGAAVIGTS